MILTTTIGQGFKTIHEQIKKKLGGIDFMYCGTISFIAYGVYYREPKDIDIIVSPTDFEIIKQKVESIVDSESEGENLSIVVSGKTVDIFRQSKLKNPVQFKEIEFGFTKVMVQHPQYSIQAKLFFLKNYVDQLFKGQPLTDKQKIGLEKHSNDVSTYNKWRKDNKEKISHIH